MLSHRFLRVLLIFLLLYSFFFGSSEVNKALNKTCSLYRRWLELQDDNGSNNPIRDELDWTSTELRNALRSIEWDLEDLEDTINILLINLYKKKKFKLYL